MQRACDSTGHINSAQHTVLMDCYFSPFQQHGLKCLQNVTEAFSTCFCNVLYHNESLIYPVCTDCLLSAGHCFRPGECKDLIIKGRQERNI